MNLVMRGITPIPSSSATSGSCERSVLPIPIAIPSRWAIGLGRFWPIAVFRMRLNDAALNLAVDASARCFSSETSYRTMRRRVLARTLPKRLCTF